MPVAPDFSNMIPARLTGKPFWDLYLYQDPPIWEAYIACAKRFDIDSVMDGYFGLVYPGENHGLRGSWDNRVAHRTMLLEWFDRYLRDQPQSWTSRWEGAGD